MGGLILMAIFRQADSARRHKPFPTVGGKMAEFLRVSVG